MLCPVDQVELQMADRQGIEIDYCPRCRGVWLDRGELDKLIERVSPMSAAPGQERFRGERGRDYRDYDDDDDDDDGGGLFGGGGRRGRRGGWLGDIFNID